MNREKGDEKERKRAGETGVVSPPATVVLPLFLCVSVRQLQLNNKLLKRIACLWLQFEYITATGVWSASTYSFNMPYTYILLICTFSLFFSVVIAVYPLCAVAWYARAFVATIYEKPKNALSLYYFVHRFHIFLFAAFAFGLQWHFCAPRNACEVCVRSWACVFDCVSVAVHCVTCTCIYIYIMYGSQCKFHLFNVLF